MNRHFEEGIETWSQHRHHIHMNCAEIQLVEFFVQNALDNVDTAPPALQREVSQELNITLEEMLGDLLVRLGQSADKPWPTQEVSLEVMPKTSYN